MSRNRILMVQPSLRPPGGGNGVCAWMLEALRDDYQLSLLTWTPVDLDEVNGYFGTTLRRSDLAIYVLPAWLRVAVDRLPFSASTLKSAILRRRAYEMSSRFDLVMSANNESDFGCRPGIQYIHYPVRHVPPLPVDLRWYHSRNALRVYEWLWSRVSAFDDQHMRANLTLVNSAWTGKIVANHHGIPVRIVYPPAAGEFPNVPWANRDQAFVCIGRLSPEKRLDQVIDIVGRVRKTYPMLRLHIVGADDDRRYARRIRDYAREAGPWITIAGTLSIGALERLVSRTRYAIHGMAEEHFGMSVAQALRAGCIPFVADGGGQVEIVGDAPLLRYRTVDDAVAKITKVLGNHALQQQLRARLSVREPLFAPEHFMNDIRTAVAEAVALARRPAPLNPQHIYRQNVQTE